MTPWSQGRIVAGDWIVIRDEGPRGGPGMREMLGVTAAVIGAGPRRHVCLITDGRFSGAPAELIGHIAPGGVRGRTDRAGPRRRHDRVDAREGHLDVELAAAELERRRAATGSHQPATRPGVLAKYARLVGPAEYGAVCG